MVVLNPKEFAESRFGIVLKRAGRQEWAGPCPWCGGEDRFHIWERGNYWCRPAAGHCSRSGWLDELDGVNPPSETDRLRWRVEALERQQRETEQRLSVLEYMHKCQDHLLYHKNLESCVKAVDYWLTEGINGHTIHNYKLGYCRSCPTAPEHDSYTIPVTYQGMLYNIRHRLVVPPNGGKYRPHRAGLPSMIFNADDLHSNSHRILILEGEKKSMVVGQETGIANVATMGMQSFKPEWVGKLDAFGLVYVLYDPDATSKAREVAGYFGQRGRVVELPVKADEFFFVYNGTAAEFTYYLNTARPVRA